jgi:predicted nuclease of restriction endonuclease-like (RecB) superfamily
MLVEFNGKYSALIQDIGNVLSKGRLHGIQTINTILVETYWLIGKQIAAYEAERKISGDLNTPFFEKLSRDLSEQYGKPFKRSNLMNIRRFYQLYPNVQTLSGRLTWSHYCELMSISDPLERSFYAQQTAHEKWTVRELKRQKKTLLFHRLALSKDKEGVLKLAAEGQIVEEAKDLMRDPYVLEFLEADEQPIYLESDLEQRIIDRLQQFLLELGKGFTFVARQYRMTINNRHFKVDLVFYHRFLRCFILIDLKKHLVDYSDVGQMNMYINYFRKEENTPQENDPIGIILAADKDELTVEYALGGITNQIFVSQYQLYLPQREELERQLRLIMNDEEDN